MPPHLHDDSEYLVLMLSPADVLVYHLIILTTTLRRIIIILLSLHYETKKRQGVWGVLTPANRGSPCGLLSPGLIWEKNDGAEKVNAGRTAKNLSFPLRCRVH